MHASVVFFGQESMSRKDCAAADFYFYISHFPVTALLKCKMAYICRLHKSKNGKLKSLCLQVGYMY